MRARALAILAALLTIGLTLTASADDRLVVYAVNQPLAYFAERIAGDTADVVMPVPRGQEPAFWMPSIAELAAVQQADLILLNGAGYAGWTRTAALPRSRLVDTSRGFADRYIASDAVTHSHGPEGAHSHGATASVTWLDFSLAIQQAEAVADALSRRRPDQAETYGDLLAELRADLTTLDDEARAIGAVAGDTLFVASHPLYQYFARAYGLRMISLDWEADEPITESQWADFDDLRAGEARMVMIWEREPPPSSMSALADRGVQGMVFPIADSPGEVDFLATMQASLAALEAAVGGS